MPKFIVASVFTNSGIAKESKNPYSMTRSLVLMPFSDIDNSNFQSHGQGFSAVELSVHQSFATQLQNHFNANFKGLPIQLDLATTFDSQAKTIITGFAVAEKVA